MGKQSYWKGIIWHTFYTQHTPIGVYLNMKFIKKLPFFGPVLNNSILLSVQQI